MSEDKYPSVTVSATTVTIDIAAARDVTEPKHFKPHSEEMLLWHAGELIRRLEMEAVKEQEKRVKMLAENKIVQARIREFLTDDELKALNAAGLGGVIVRVAAGLNSAKFGDPVRVNVQLPEEAK